MGREGGTTEYSEYIEKGELEWELALRYMLAGKRMILASAAAALKIFSLVISSVAICSVWEPVLGEILMESWRVLWD